MAISIARSADLELSNHTERHVLRDLVALELRALPIREEALHLFVSTYVRASRSRGIKSALIIRSLFEIVNQLSTASSAERDNLRQRMAMWSIDAYFGPRISNPRSGCSVRMLDAH